MHDDHQTLTIQEYRANANKIKVRLCDKHEDQPYSVGCRDCLSLCCVKCLSGLKNCTSTNALVGVNHQLCSLEELSSELKQDIDALTSKLGNKEGEWASLSKAASMLLSDFISETERFVGCLHKTRDEQIQELTLGYKNLEAEFVIQREAIQAKISQFIEVDVNKERLNFFIERSRIAAKLRQSHQVEIVNDYRETKQHINNLLNKETPVLRLRKVPELRTTGITRNLEMEITDQDTKNVDTLAISSDSEDLSYYECQATGKEPESECSDCEVGAFGHAESLSEVTGKPEPIGYSGKQKDLGGGPSQSGVSHSLMEMFYRNMNKQ
ncbi:hypothetical protein EB796_019226 [Bugula neritina]|uniref:Uncharacterized protein n=1 Tax=Bugula neritina TaxID=10212 RepID=A0A7J7JAR3_BUGNE|nr:hypothetical protein EB796_019226 [Bugula neritina]